MSGRRSGSGPRKKKKGVLDSSSSSAASTSGSDDDSEHTSETSSQTSGTVEVISRVDDLHLSASGSPGTVGSQAMAERISHMGSPDSFGKLDWSKRRMSSSFGFDHLAASGTVSSMRLDDSGSLLRPASRFPVRQGPRNPSTSSGSPEKKAVEVLSSGSGSVDSDEDRGPAAAAARASPSPGRGAEKSRQTSLPPLAAKLRPADPAAAQPPAPAAAPPAPADPSDDTDIDDHSSSDTNPAAFTDDDPPKADGPVPPETRASSSPSTNPQALHGGRTQQDTGNDSDASDPLTSDDEEDAAKIPLATPERSRQPASQPKASTGSPAAAAPTTAPLAKPAADRGAEAPGEPPAAESKFDAADLSSELTDESSEGEYRVPTAPVSDAGPEVGGGGEQEKESPSDASLSSSLHGEDEDDGHEVMAGIRSLHMGFATASAPGATTASPPSLAAAADAAKPQTGWKQPPGLLEPDEEGSLDRALAMGSVSRLSRSLSYNDPADFTAPPAAVAAVAGAALAAVVACPVFVAAALRRKKKVVSVEDDGLGPAARRPPGGGAEAGGDRCGGEEEAMHADPACAATSALADFVLQDTGGGPLRTGGAAGARPLRARGSHELQNNLLSEQGYYAELTAVCGSLDEMESEATRRGRHDWVAAAQQLRRLHADARDLLLSFSAQPCRSALKGGASRAMAGPSLQSVLRRMESISDAFDLTDIPKKKHAERDLLESKAKLLHAEEKALKLAAELAVSEKKITAAAAAAQPGPGNAPAAGREVPAIPFDADDPTHVRLHRALTAVAAERDELLVERETIREEMLQHAGASTAKEAIIEALRREAEASVQQVRLLQAGRGAGIEHAAKLAAENASLQRSVRSLSGELNSLKADAILFSTASRPATLAPHSFDPWANTPDASEPAMVEQPSEEHTLLASRTRALQTQRDALEGKCNDAVRELAAAEEKAVQTQRRLFAAEEEAAALKRELRAAERPAVPHEAPARLEGVLAALEKERRRSANLEVKLNVARDRYESVEADVARLTGEIANVRRLMSAEQRMHQSHVQSLIDKKTDAESLLVLAAEEQLQAVRKQLEESEVTRSSLERELTVVRMQRDELKGKLTQHEKTTALDAASEAEQRSAVYRRNTHLAERNKELEALLDQARQSDPDAAYRTAANKSTQASDKPQSLARVKATASQTNAAPDWEGVASQSRKSEERASSLLEESEKRLLALESRITDDERRHQVERAALVKRATDELAHLEAELRAEKEEVWLLRQKLAKAGIEKFPPPSPGDGGRAPRRPPASHAWTQTEPAGALCSPSRGTEPGHAPRTDEPTAARIPSPGACRPPRGGGDAARGRSPAARSLSPRAGDGRPSGQPGVLNERRGRVFPAHMEESSPKEANATPKSGVLKERRGRISPVHTEESSRQKANAASKSGVLNERRGRVFPAHMEESSLQEANAMPKSGALKERRGRISPVHTEESSRQKANAASKSGVLNESRGRVFPAHMEENSPQEANATPKSGVLKERRGRISPVHAEESGLQKASATSQFGVPNERRGRASPAHTEESTWQPANPASKPAAPDGATANERSGRASPARTERALPQSPPPAPAKDLFSTPSSPSLSAGDGPEEEPRRGSSAFSSSSSTSLPRMPSLPDSPAAAAGDQRLDRLPWGASPLRTLPKGPPARQTSGVRTATPVDPVNSRGSRPTRQQPPATAAEAGRDHPTPSTWGASTLRTPSSKAPPVRAAAPTDASASHVTRPTRRQQPEASQRPTSPGVESCSSAGDVDRPGAPPKAAPGPRRAAAKGAADRRGQLPLEAGLGATVPLRDSTGTLNVQGDGYAGARRAKAAALQGRRSRRHPPSERSRSLGMDAGGGRERQPPADTAAGSPSGRGASTERSRSDGGARTPPRKAEVPHAFLPEAAAAASMVQRVKRRVESRQQHLSMRAPPAKKLPGKPSWGHDAAGVQLPVNSALLKYYGSHVVVIRRLPDMLTVDSIRKLLLPCGVGNLAEQYARSFGLAPGLRISRREYESYLRSTNAAKRRESIVTTAGDDGARAPSGEPAAVVGSYAAMAKKKQSPPPSPARSPDKRDMGRDLTPREFLKLEEALLKIKDIDASRYMPASELLAKGAAFDKRRKKQYNQWLRQTFFPECS
ncbi:hypothetical protein DIPPA_00498 [Diplonema papillatum]|nr:hypothetical protein DIPPA_00498 [Diplonema papillatum]